MSAPDILADIKADLGITASTDDAWLQRRIAAIWARMEVYTSRRLCAPPATFVDDWGTVVSTAPVWPVPPIVRHPPRASVFLRYFPVVSIEQVELDGAPFVTVPMFDGKTGKVLSVYDASPWAGDMSTALRNGRAKITYTAGWATVPPDLYEIVLGAIQPLWSAKRGGGIPGVAGNVTGINVMDVGSVELAEASLFVSSASKTGGGTGDPLLGPYANMLDLYIDHRSRLGWEGQASTIELAATPLGKQPAALP